MELLAIDSGNGYEALPSPSVYSTVPNEISRFYRNPLGLAFKFRTAFKTGIDVTWNVLTPAQKTQIMSLTHPNFFSVRYFDLEDSTVKYGTFYRGSDPQVKPVRRFDGKDFDYYAVTLKLVER